MERAKTVWVINQFAGTPTSGWGERHYYLSEYWIASGYRVVLVSGSYNHMFTTLPEAPHTYTCEDVEGRRFCWVKTPHYRAESILRFWSMIVFALRVIFLPVEKLGKPDVILVSSMPIFPIVSGYLLKKRYRAERLIFEIRDLWPLTPIQHSGYSERHPFIRMLAWLERFGYRRADAVVSLLPNAEPYIAGICGDASKIHYIPNGIGAGQLVAEPLEQDIEAALPGGKFIVGYAGTLGLANAMSYFVEAARLLQGETDIHFVIVGEGYLKEELVRQAQGLKNVTFVRKVRKNQVQALLQRFDVCYVGRHDLPLYRYGVSANKYFDYMLSGKPILDSNNAIKAPVELSGCGLVVRPESAEAIRDGILSLYRMDADARNAMGQKGRAYVRKFHDTRYLAEQYACLFEERGVPAEKAVEQDQPAEVG